ncbi:DUF3098 domain-containing protein [Bacteroidales bacterium OttesenSCG-928-K03]|nr:DUF3098 domain-containing protein [Odoribacter sp. OttesenSCG-928-L07]MDL2239006.1 DUF3098 domain-containing protein [Bacteroidales bacterium OttesenSCG-928-L14]MDL2240706.1 DUF3098 domain-containing protein [Bacteroidales bacterium OttesenSCG-928-K22]MDL2242156.1 DUF3098 domain-containing protein [Bacteroidales bacterium OttesenSCG-928-K03]
MNKKQQTKEVTQNTEKKVIFQKTNYILFFVGLAVLILGFVLMIGGGSDDPDVFNEKMFGFQRLTLAPLLLILGFAIEFFAIFYKAKKK